MNFKDGDKVTLKGIKKYGSTNWIDFMRVANHQPGDIYVVKYAGSSYVELHCPRSDTFHPYFKLDEIELYCPSWKERIEQGD
jgi:hypothetical protein